jgi:hypothetical protein
MNKAELKNIIKGIILEEMSYDSPRYDFGNSYKMKITPFHKAGTIATGQLVNINVDEIEKKLGFAANVKDDSYKIKYSWGFQVDGITCGIWDYKGSWKDGTFSTYGPGIIFVNLFGYERYKTTK